MGRRDRSMSSPYGRLLLDQLPPNHLNGLAMTWTDADTFAVAAGKARDSADVLNLVLAASISKDVANDSAWTAGAGGNALPSVAQGLGRSASTWYAVFLIGGRGIASDWGMDTSLTAANLLAAAQAVDAHYTSYRRIGWVFADASENILEWHQYGDEFLWETPVRGYNDGGDVDYTGASTARTIDTAPPSVRMHGTLHWRSLTAGAALTWSHTDQVLGADAAANASDPGAMVREEGATEDGVPFTVLLDASRQFRVRAGADNAARITINVYGWIDRRGKDT